MNEHTDWSELGWFFQLVFIVVVVGTVLLLTLEAFWLLWSVFIGGPPPLSGVIHG